MTYTHSWYQSPIELSEKDSGKFRIRHGHLKAGDRVQIVGTRQALLRGLKPTVAVVGKGGLRVHNLQELQSVSTYGTWMTDLPEELNQIEEMLYTVHPQGNVLIGGLGLGIAAIRTAQQVGVKSVTVIERSRDVIKLCANHQQY